MPQWAAHPRGSHIWAVLCGAHLAIATIQPTPAGAVPIDSHQLSAKERKLRALLAQYQSGDVAGAADQLLRLPSGWMAASVDDTVARIDADIKYHRRPENRLGISRDERVLRLLRSDKTQVLLLGASLQLDAACAARDVESVGTAVVVSERIIDRIYDLQSDLDQHGPVSAAVKVQEPPEESNPPALTSRIGWPELRRFAARWYTAAVARLQGLVELRLAPALIKRGLARKPDDVDLLLAQGSLVETRLALSRVDGPLALRLYDSAQRRQWNQDLRSAQDAYQRALEGIGACGEVAVRLARVRLLQGDTQQSQELLDKVLRQQLAPELRYLALLFRAAVAERANNVSAAISDYRAAHALFPEAQTPATALSRVADELGQFAEAKEWADRAVESASTGPDPWRRYIQGQAWQLDKRMTALRGAVQ